MHVHYMAIHGYEHADEDRIWDMVMFLVTTLEMMLTGLQEKPMIFIFHVRIYFVAFFSVLHYICPCFFYARVFMLLHETVTLC